MNNDQFVTKWALDTVMKKYADDIALVVSHTTLNIDAETDTISYFVPITDKGRQFAQTFLLGGRGYNIWGIEWNRLEKFAALEEYNLTVLADRKILYARTPEDAARFEALRQKQAANLADHTKSRKCALEAYARAKGLYAELLFATGSGIRLCAGYMLDYLAQAIAFSNHRYFRQSQVNQLEELKTLEYVPSGFAEKYLEVIRTPDDDHRKRLCHDLVGLVGNFLAPDAPQSSENNFQDLADWYAELSYTWLRIRHYAQQNDPIKAHMWGIMLQNELDAVCADFGLPKIELMSEFDFEDLGHFAASANMLEGQVREMITRHGGIIREYDTPEEFLHDI